MNDGSGITPPIGGQASSSGTIGKGIAGQLQNASRELQNVPRAERIEGRVVRENRDGSIRIQTPKGEIDVKVQTRNPPQAGQRVEVEIPAGRPPRQVVIRQVPAQAPPPQTQVQAPPQGQTSTAQPAVRPAPATQTPLPPQTTPVANQTPAPLQQGQIVRLLPLPPAQAQQIAQQILNTVQILPNALPQIQTTPNLVLPALQTPALTPSLQIATPILQNTLQLFQTNPTPSQPANIFQTLQIANVQTTPITQSLAPLLNFQTATPVPQITPQVNIPAQPIQLPAISTLQTIPVTPQFPNPANMIAATPTPQITVAAPQATPQVQIQTAPLDVKILNIQPPNIQITAPGAQTTSTILTPPPITTPIVQQATATTLPAQVTGFTPQNLPVVSFTQAGQTFPQLFTMQFTAANLQQGSQIQILPQTGALPATPVAAPITPQSFTLGNLFGTGPWPAVDEIFQALQQANPQAAQALARVLPSPANPAQMGPAALFFLAAVRSGDIGAWLGDRAQDTLRRIGQTNLTGRLGAETQALNRAGAEPISQDWRGMSIPMMWQSEVHKITLYYKRDEGSGDDADNNNARTRFIFDLNLERMGDVQLDGLVQGPRLDLMVRSESPFSQPMQQAMRGAYTTALEQSQLHGELNFQGDQNWVHVLQREEIFGESA